MARNVAEEWSEQVAVVAIGGAQNFDCRGWQNLTIIADPAGGTLITWSRIDSMAAVAHNTNTGTVAAGVAQALVVDWPFYRVSAAVGPARVSRH